MAGYSVVTIPDLGQGKESNVGFAYIGSVMARYHVHDRISLVANADYFHTKVSSDLYNIKQSVSTLSLGVGIAYRFN